MGISSSDKKKRDFLALPVGNFRAHVSFPCRLPLGLESHAEGLKTERFFVWRIPCHVSFWTTGRVISGEVIEMGDFGLEMSLVGDACSTVWTGAAVIGTS